MRFNRIYDFQRALCEDPKLIGTDNETGLDWIQHFNKHTASRTKGIYCILVLDGHESHESAEFQEYCKAHNIITLGLPAHSSHLTQPLDMGCFSVLKRAYGRQIETYVKAHINHITKVEFFIAFKATPRNPTDALLQTTLVKSRIACHQGSSPIPIFQTVAALAKNSNEALSKRRRAKKSCIRQGGAFTVKDAYDVLAQKDVDEQMRRDLHTESGGQKGGQPRARYCGTCGKPGHNARTCQADVDMSSSSESD
ncbi:hypothetical protein V491_00001 [Pseudogymnoascus sp. VKM F-3775]|nr:hypothetical protein V491_00001 [Pseudogymnoascus sp. VKM F-3775]